MKKVLFAIFFMIMLMTNSVFAWESEPVPFVKISCYLQYLRGIIHIFCFSTAFVCLALILFKKISWWSLFDFLLWILCLTVTGWILDYVAVEDEDVLSTLPLFLPFFVPCLLPVSIYLIQYKIKKIDKKILKHRLFVWFIGGFTLILYFGMCISVLKLFCLWN